MLLSQLLTVTGTGRLAVVVVAIFLSLPPSCMDSEGDELGGALSLLWQSVTGLLLLGLLSLLFIYDLLGPTRPQVGQVQVSSLNARSSVKSTFIYIFFLSF